ncbi:MAG: hypothetical protein PUI41_11645 [Lachnospiraceae bacterium]|nr:hypothetical protein [Lachnospiraceae bacterium]
MKEVFEKIIEKLDEYKYENLVEHDSEQSQHCKDAGDCKGMDCSLCVFNKAIEIVKQEAEQYNNGWIPCSERLPEVPEGTEDDDCPEFNVTIKGASRAAILRCSSDGTWFDEFGHVYPVIAWQPLPEPYQPKGE